MTLARDTAQRFLSSVIKQLPVIIASPTGLRVEPKIGASIEIRSNQQVEDSRVITYR